MARFRINPWIRRTHVRECLGALSLLALLMQAPIPAGFMPDGRGAAFLKLCIGLITKATDTSGARSGHSTAAMCPFGAGAPAGAAPASPTSSATTSEAVQFFLPIVARWWPQGIFGPARAQSPRAPPVFHS